MIAATVAMSTPSIWTQRPADPPNRPDRLRSKRRADAPLAEEPVDEEQPRDHAGNRRPPPGPEGNQAGRHTQDEDHGRDLRIVNPRNDLDHDPGDGDDQAGQGQLAGEGEGKRSVVFMAPYSVGDGRGRRGHGHPVAASAARRC